MNILGDSEELVSLGKHVWVLKYQEGLNNSDRIQIMDAFITILERSGGPLSAQELKEKVAEYRGVKAQMQISPNSTMIRINPDQWGLIHRDIPLNMEELKICLNHLHAKLEQFGKPGAFRGLIRGLQLL